MTVLFAFPEQQALADALVRNGAYAAGAWEWRHFPDGESYVRVTAKVKGQKVALLCSLNAPDEKTVPLVFLARTLRALGAVHVTLLAPYLPYLRQDIEFHGGEAVSATLFADIVSPHIDALVTLDPHLHRITALKEVYHCHCTVLSAAPLMAEWIRAHIAAPVIIGPDAESEQWVHEVAAAVNAPYVILQKTRHGDRQVEIILPDMEPYKPRTPVLVDDMISTAGTMVKTLELLRAQGFAGMVCLATHGLFAGDALARLQAAGAAHIITANSITHTTNALDIAPLLMKGTPHAD